MVHLDAVQESMSTAGAAPGLLGAADKASLQQPAAAALHPLATSGAASPFPEGRSTCHAGLGYSADVAAWS